MYCPRCGTQNAEGSLKCTNCGFELQSVAAPAASAAGDGIEVLIPRPPLHLKLSQASPPTTWRREEIYGDDGR